MKKINVWMMLFLMIVTSFAMPFSVFAEDGVVPKLESVTLNKNSFKPGEKVTLTIQSSNITMIRINWRKSDGSTGKGKSIDSFFTIKKGTTNYQMTIPAEIENGDYIVGSVYAWMDDNDVKRYTTFGPWNGLSLDSIKLTITDSTYTAPTQLSDVKITKFEELGRTCVDENDSHYCDFSFGVTVDDASDINSVYLSDDKGSYGGYSIKTKQNYFVIDMIMSETTASYNYDRVKISRSSSVQDVLLKDVYSKSSIVCRMDNYVVDKNAPELLSVDYPSDDIQLPGALAFTIRVKDDYSNPMIKAYYKDQNGTEYTLVDQTVFDGGVSYGSVWFEESTFIQSVYLDRIELKDVAGNVSLYSVDNGKIQKKVYQLKKPEYDAVIQYSDSDRLEKLKSFKKGEKVLYKLSYNRIITKDVLDAIRGNDVNVTFGYTYTNSYSDIFWSVNGKNVSADTKDINTRLGSGFQIKRYSKYMLSYYAEYLAIYEDPSNPWRANGEPYDVCVTSKEEDNKIRELLTEYFHRMKEDGYKDADQYLEKVLEFEGLECGMGVGSSHALKESNMDKYIEYTLDSVPYIDIYDLIQGQTLPGKFTVSILLPQYTVRDFGSKGLYLYQYTNSNSFSLKKRIDMKDGLFTVDVQNDDYYVISNGVFEKLKKDSDAASVMGDLSGDEEVTFTDVIICLRKVFGYTDKSDNDVLIGDFNHNGELDFADVIILLRYVFGYISEL